MEICEALDDETYKFIYLVIFEISNAFIHVKSKTAFIHYFE